MDGDPDKLLIEFITLYLAKVREAIALFVASYGDDRPPHAWRQCKLPQIGPLGRNPISRMVSRLTCGRIFGAYHFHGIGCYFDLPGLRIGVDFGPGGRHDGFDGWRLWRFARENPTVKCPLGIENDNGSSFEQALERLARTGIIVRPGTSPGHALFYVSTLATDFEGPTNPVW